MKRTKIRCASTCHARYAATDAAAALMEQHKFNLNFSGSASGLTVFQCF